MVSSPWCTQHSTDQQSASEQSGEARVTHLLVEFLSNGPRELLVVDGRF